MILNTNRTKALVVSSSRTLSHPYGDLILSGVSIRASPNLDILWVTFDSKLTFEDHLHDIVFRIFQRIGILRLVKRIFVDTSVLLRCYFAFVLPVLVYCSQVCGSAAECHLQLLKRQVYSVVVLCSDKSFLLLYHRRRVAGLSALYNVNSNSNYSLFSEHPSSTRVRLEFEVSWYRTSQFPRSFLPAQVRLWNDLPFTVFSTPERWMSSWVQSPAGCFPELCFLQFSVAQVLVGLRKQFINTLFFPLGPVLMVLIIIIINKRKKLDQSKCGQNYWPPKNSQTSIIACPSLLITNCNL